MRKTLSASCLALFGLCVLSLSGSPAYGRVKTHTQVQKPALVHQGIVQDWSHRHVLYPRGGSLRTLLILQHDPRAMQSWQAASRANWPRPIRGRNPKKGIHRDWDISLGNGGTAAAMYPAKFGYDPSALPNCLNDFVVFPVDVAGSGTQPNLVAFNNLYSGTYPVTGICSSRPVPGGVTDNTNSATTMWSYNINGGAVLTSPALSLDGTKVAVADTEGGVAHFHVLAWKSGDGQDTNRQNVLLPKTISSFTDPLAPVAGSGTASDLTLGSTTDTLSSPFVDYFNDLAYVGNDSGTLYRLKDVFCTITVTTGTITVNPDCAVAPGPAPSLDTTWGTLGALTTGCPGKLSGPVVDSVTGNIFVGCSDGKLYGFTSAGLALANSPLAVGDGSATGGIVDPPVLDVTNGFVYVVSGNDGTHAVLVQAKTADLSGKIVATLGPGGVFNLHAPSFNDLYFSSVYSTSGGVSNWLIYEFAAFANGTGINAGNGGYCNPNLYCTTLYAVGFNGSYNLSTSASPSPLIYPTLPAYELSPSTEFVSGGVDRLFDCQIQIPASYDSFQAFNITGAFPAGGYYATLSVGTPNAGTSGIVVDNASGLAQAASVYYSVLSQNLAAKVTQSGLN